MGFTLFFSERYLSMFASNGNGPTDNIGCGEVINEKAEFLRKQEVMPPRSLVEEVAFS